MPQDSATPSTARSGGSGGGKRTLVVLVGLIILLALVALAFLRPVVDRRDGPELEEPSVVTPPLPLAPEAAGG